MNPERIILTAKKLEITEQIVHFHERLAEINKELEKQNALDNNRTESQE